MDTILRFALLILLPCGQMWATITCSNLTSGAAHASSITSFTTASITPSANNFVMVSVFEYNSGSANQTVSSITGDSLTFVNVNSISLSGQGNHEVWRAQKASPTTGALTVNLSATTSEFYGYSVDQCSGTAIDTANNGAAAVAQSVTNDNASSSSMSVTLAALQSSASVAIGSFASAAALITAGSGFTTIEQLNATVFVTTEQQLNVTSVTASMAAAHAWNGVALELVPPATVIPKMTLTHIGP